MWINLPLNSEEQVCYEHNTFSSERCYNYMTILTGSLNTPNKNVHQMFLHWQSCLKLLLLEYELSHLSRNNTILSFNLHGQKSINYFGWLLKQADREDTKEILGTSYSTIINWLTLTLIDIFSIC